MKEERETTSDSPPRDASTTLNSSHEKTRPNVDRRSFLGQTIAILTAAFGGLWSLTSPQRAEAIPCYCGGPPPPPPPPNYTTQSEALVNNICAAYNAHNAATLVSYFDSATIDTATLQTHLQNTFNGFPQTSITQNSMTAGPYGSTITLNWTIQHDYTTATTDSPLVTANGVNPTQSDTVTGQTVFFIASGSIVTNMDTTHNIPPVFSAHGATVAP